MDTGEWLTRGTVWLALSLYVGGEMAKVIRREIANPYLAAARWLNSLGCAAFLAHVACAFHFYHGWSHAAAYADTARQTAALFRWKWGGGLYLNYLFALIWLGEVAWSWVSPHRHVTRPKWVGHLLRGLFLFMMVNGAVVFVHGPARWFGMVLCLTLAGCWWRGAKQIDGPSAPSRRRHQLDA